MVVNSANLLLVQLGLSDYEARAYTALLAHQPATAYEIAKQSGIPSSKIYETVNRLVEKGMLLLVEDQQGRGKRYCAQGVDEFVEHKRAETQRQTDQLAEALRSLHDPAEAEIIWPLRDSSAILSKAAQLIAHAQSTCLVSLWGEELEALQEELLAAEARGVRIALVHFGVPQQEIGATYYHPAEETLYQEKGGRGLTLVCDSEAVVIATFLPQGGAEGSWSRNRTFVTVAEDYVRHDVYITKVTGSMDAQIKQRFGNHYEKMRDVFTP